jgi:hypothetical protein
MKRKGIAWSGALILLASGCVTTRAGPLPPPGSPAELATSPAPGMSTQAEAPEPCEVEGARQEREPVSRSPDPSLPQTPMPTSGTLTLSAGQGVKGRSTVEAGNDATRCQSRRARGAVSGTGER